MPDSLLEASGVDKHFGGVAALRGASLEVRAGEVHALMGENGAGKSTLARIVAGAVRADAGSFRVDGRTAAIATPLDAQRLGIGIIHQELDLFPNLSAGENIVIGNLCFHEGRWARFRRMETFCRPFLEQVGLACSVHQPAASLSIGHRQLLAIARALSMNARLLLMDEPTSSLFDDAVERLFELIRHSTLPVICSSMDSYRIASCIHSMTVKTLPGDKQKINRIQELISAHVNLDRVLEKILA